MARRIQKEKQTTKTPRPSDDSGSSQDSQRGAAASKRAGKTSDAAGRFLGRKTT
jgi:hypothetical protein